MTAYIRVFQSHTTAMIDDQDGDCWEQKSFYHTPTRTIYSCIQNAYNWLESYGFDRLDVRLVDWTRVN